MSTSYVASKRKIDMVGVTIPIKLELYKFDCSCQLYLCRRQKLANKRNLSVLLNVWRQFFTAQNSNKLYILVLYERIFFNVKLMVSAHFCKFRIFWSKKLKPVKTEDCTGVHTLFAKFFFALNSKITEK